MNTATPTAGQLARMSEAELNRRLLSPMVIDGLLSDINRSIESDAAHAERLAQDESEPGREYDGGL